MLSHAPSGKQMPWRSASKLSRLRLKCPVRLVRPDTQDAIFFFLIDFRQLELAGVEGYWV